MKKSVLIKGILVLIAIALLTMGFTGCGTIIPTTGTVVIIIAGSYTYYNYNVYLNSWFNQIGITSGGTFTATGLTPGLYTFYVDDTIWNWYWDSGTVWVTAGVTTYITLSPW